MTTKNPSIRWGKPLSVLFWTLFTLGLGVFPVQAGIANTMHNLSASSAATNNRVGATDANGEICAFCHTPHAADTTAPVPLWNKQLNTGATYTTYATLNSSSIDGEILPVGSISLACLSCLVGAQAMDNLINAPGSGGYDVTGGGANGLGYTWSGTRVDATGKMINSATSLAMLGNDLSNDHPIGIRYCGGGPTNAAPGTACVDPDFVVPTSGVVNGNTVFWVDTTGGTAGRNKTDMQLYTRTFAGATAAPSVECGSCHDPHADETVPNPGGLPNAGPTFLRIANTNSNVCLACHVK